MKRISSAHQTRNTTIYSKAFCGGHEKKLVKYSVPIVNGFGLICESPDRCDLFVTAHGHGYFYPKRYCVTHKKMPKLKQLTRFRYPFNMLENLMPTYDIKCAEVLQSDHPFCLVLISSQHDLRHVRDKGAREFTEVDVYLDRLEAFVASAMFLIHCIRHYKDRLLNTSSVCKIRRPGNVKMVLAKFPVGTARWQKADFFASITDHQAPLDVILEYGRSDADIISGNFSDY